jgi:hypothetical protein
MPWSTPFDDPIRLQGGARLATLQQAADFIMHLPSEVQQLQRWQIAVENLINAAETGGGWLMFARIGMMRALNLAGQAQSTGLLPNLGVSKGRPSRSKHQSDHGIRRAGHAG